jgi:hypothetical protein
MYYRTDIDIALLAFYGGWLDREQIEDYIIFAFAV